MTLMTFKTIKFDNCGEDFGAVSTKAKYCSDVCKSMMWQSRHHEEYRAYQRKYDVIRYAKKKAKLLEVAK